MLTADFDYELPPSAIAQHPIEPRDRARLLVAVGDEVVHGRVADLAAHLRAGDVVVVNETKVSPVRLGLRKPTGGEVEVLLLEPMGDEWVALVRPSRRLAPGTILDAGGRGEVEIGRRLDDGRRAVVVRPRVGCSFEELIAAVGVLPLPPYITEPLDDPERYQTMFARHPGSAAAPTAGLHFTEAVVRSLDEAGVALAKVNLTVGLGTFRPVTAECVDDHVMHAERYEVPDATLAAIADAQRVVAVGTTTLRALESAARQGPTGSTDLFIRRPFDFAVVDVLMTNFHLPRSSLLMLLDAFAGERWRDLYGEALAQGYRFLSFGDAMLVDRRGPGAAA